MASRTTHTYTITVYTIGGGEFTAQDGADSKAGYTAWQSFLHGSVIEIPGEENTTTYVPYHAIDHITVQASTESETYTDDTCVTE